MNPSNELNILSGVSEPSYEEQGVIRKLSDMLFQNDVYTKQLFKRWSSTKRHLNRMLRRKNQRNRQKIDVMKWVEGAY